MGQKVNPHGMRVGIIKNWDSRWYAEKDFADNLIEDHQIREFVKKKMKEAEISKVEIERKSNAVRLVITAGKQGIIIGKGGENIKNFEAELKKLVKKEVKIEVKEMKGAAVNLDAQIVAMHIAKDLENRISFRRAMKQAMQRTMKDGAKGIKASCAGRLGGADIARTEFYSEGTIPLQTLRADIDYGFAEADTTYGKVGVKVWIYKGEVLPKKKKQEGDK